MNPQRAMTAREWLLLLGLASIWSTSFYLFKVLLLQLPVLTIVLGRVAIAAVLLWAVVYLSGQRMPSSWRLWGSFLLMGTLNNAIPFSLIVLGETRIASGMAAILNATTPLFTVLIAHYATRDERFTVSKAAGLIIGFAGVIVLVAPRSLGALNLGALAVIGASLSYAIAGLFGKRFKAVSPVVTAAGQVTASTALLLPIAFVADKPWTLAMPGMTTWAGLIALGVMCTALAYLLYFRVLATAGATNLMLVTFLTPIGAVVLGAIALHETLSARSLTGAGIVFLGVAAIDGRLFKLLRGSRSRVACTEMRESV